MSWAYLNAEGKRHWGDIFPDGKVPIQSIIEIPAKLKGIKPTQKVYMVDWQKLSTEQQLATLQKLTELSGTPKAEILQEIQTVGLPLREKYTDAVATNRMELFL
ncbi:MAG: hypothetical protein NWE96_09745 [Candidatus Bathyarchaeota archaeon]|nr:hypothetical protein [Candidatus Bathyarchaeota archaeon]